MRAYERGAAVLHAVVLGVPAPQGSKRIVPSGKPGGRVHTIESNDATLRPWRSDIAWTVRDAKDKSRSWPLTGPIAIDLWFTMPKPRSAPKRRRSYPDRRPDVDKLSRAVLDGLKTAHAITDDGQVVQLHATKVYPTEHPMALDLPGLRLTLYRIGGS